MGFIAETFMRSIQAASTQVDGMRPDRIMRLISNVLANGWTASVVEAERLIAWAVHGDANRLAWIYVREMHRGEGVARWLLAKIGHDPAKPVISPFLPNRAPWRGKLYHRPFECVA